MKIIRLPIKLGIASIEKYVKAAKDGEGSMPSNINFNINSKASQEVIRRFEKQKRLIENARK